MNSRLRTIIIKFPRLKRLLKSMLPKGSVSSNYVLIRCGEEGLESSRLRDAWKDMSLPSRQRELVDLRLQNFRGGRSEDVFDVLVETLRSLPIHLCGMSVLEVGCSSGYYSEVFEIANLGLRYKGCDYSDAFIRLARERYQDLRFDVEDATSLNYGDDSFDIVIPDVACFISQNMRLL